MKKSVFVLLLMCAVISAQSASLASEHSHHHSNQHCCGLCHAGPMPLLQTSTLLNVAPAVTFAWLAGAGDLATPLEILRDAGHSRAPPA